METIKRRINIKDFVEKFGKNEPCVDKEADYSGTSYGFIPYNILITEEFPTVFQSMPSYSLISGATAVKYGTFAQYYTWMRKFIMESKYYTPRKRHKKTYWTEIGEDLNYKEGNDGKYFLFNESESVLDSLPEDMSGYTCGKSIICVNESADTFFEQYKSINDAIDFLDFSEDFIFEGKYEIDEPFIELPILIEEEINDLGVEEMCWPEEIALDNENKYVDRLWKARDGFAYVKGEYGIKNGNVYKAKLDIEIGKEYDIEDWEICEWNDSETESSTTYTTESRLKNLKRQKLTIDDNNNTLDFVFNNANLKCEIPYLIGVPFGNPYDEKISAYTYDIMNSIVFTKSDGSELINYNNLNNSDIGINGKVTFKYVIGNLLTGDTSVEICTDDSGGGIMYEEEHDFTVTAITFTLNTITYMLPYIKINYNSRNGEDNVQLAKIYLKNTEETQIFANTMIRNDKVVGITDYSFNVGKINIDRGSSSSYEAFNVIGEVNSLTDIEKYHNDWFRISGKND